MRENFDPTVRGGGKRYNRQKGTNERVLFIRVNNKLHKAVSNIAEAHEISISCLIAKFLETAVATGKLR